MTIPLGSSDSETQVFRPLLWRLYVNNKGRPEVRYSMVIPRFADEAACLQCVKVVATSASVIPVSCAAAASKDVDDCDANFKRQFRHVDGSNQKTSVTNARRRGKVVVDER